MNEGQYTVLLLLFVLLGLEVLRSQAVRDFFKSVLVNPLKQGASA